MFFRLPIRLCQHKIMTDEPYSLYENDKSSPKPSKSILSWLWTGCQVLKTYNDAGVIVLHYVIHWMTDEMQKYMNK